jgi:enoyl-CoA hydratase/carnithine racemase
MRRTVHSLVASLLVAAAVPTMVLAADAAKYSVSETQVGTLLDDPAANEVLKKMIPTVYANEMFHTMGRELTLKAIQQYEPEALSDANLAKVQAELDKLTPKAAAKPAQSK